LTGHVGGLWPQLVSGSASREAPRRRINPLGVIVATAVLIALEVSIEPTGGATKSS
jgi:hypothetical protein